MKKIQKTVAFMTIAMLLAISGIIPVKADDYSDSTVDESVCDCTRKIVGTLTVYGSDGEELKTVTFDETAISASIREFSELEDEESLTAIENVKKQMTEYAHKNGYVGELEFTLTEGERVARDDRVYKVENSESGYKMYITGNYGYDASCEIRASFKTESSSNVIDDIDIVANPESDKAPSLLWLWILLAVLLLAAAVTVVVLKTRKKMK